VTGGGIPPHHPYPSPRHGDTGFDPGEHRGALGNEFHPGCHDPGDLFNRQERRIADRLVTEGASVHPRRRDDTVERKKNPDAMVRTGPDDAGTVTEFKHLDEPGTATLRRAIVNAGRQVAPYGGGDAVIDARDVELTAVDARRGYARAVGQAKAHGQTMPNRVVIMLADGLILTLPEV